MFGYIHLNLQPAARSLIEAYSKELQPIESSESNPELVGTLETL